MSGSQRPNNGPTILALVALIGAGAGLLFMSALVLPQLFGFALVVAGFFSFIALHYLVWGWWLSSISRDDDEPSE